MEIWKSLDGIVECGEYYEVSNLGKVRSIDRIMNDGKFHRGIIIKQRISNAGYFRVGLSNNFKRKFYSVRRLVALAFIPNPHNLPVVNHKDETKTNNKWNNLEWCDNRYNCNYGTFKEKSSMSKRKSIKVFKYNTKEFVGEFCSVTEASRYLGIIHQSISKVLKGQMKQTHGYYFEYVEGNK